MISKLGVCILVTLLAGCATVTQTWDQVARTNAEWAEARQLQACFHAFGAVEPYGQAHILFATGGANVVTCATIYGLPGAPLLEK